MTRRVWSDLITDEERTVIEKAGFDDGYEGTRDRGTEPAVVVIDVQRDQLGPDAPVTEAIEEYPTAIGERGWRAVEEIAALLETARAHDVPVYYFWIARDSDDWERADAEIPDEIAPRDDEDVLEKPASSGFHGTDLRSRLEDEGVDTVIVVGSSTSGCVRATAVDAASYGYSVVVPQDCVFDRIETSTKITLLDLWMKYASVLERPEVETYIEESAAE